MKIFCGSKIVIKLLYSKEEKIGNFYTQMVDFSGPVTIIHHVYYPSLTQEST